MKPILFVLLALLTSSCAKAKAAGSATAHQVDSPLPGYTCFEIDNAAGDAVGGNCAKD